MKGDYIMSRKQFTFYDSFYESIEKLKTNKEKLQAYRILCDYALHKTEPDMDSLKPGVATVFCIAKPILDTAHARSKGALKMSERKQMLSETKEMVV